MDRAELRGRLNAAIAQATEEWDLDTDGGKLAPGSQPYAGIPAVDLVAIIALLDALDAATAREAALGANYLEMQRLRIVAGDEARVAAEREAALRAALEDWEDVGDWLTDAVDAYLDPANQFTHSRRHDVEQAVAKARALLAARAALQETPHEDRSGARGLSGPLKP